MAKSYIPRPRRYVRDISDNEVAHISAPYEIRRMVWRKSLTDSNVRSLTEDFFVAGAILANMDLDEMEIDAAAEYAARWPNTRRAKHIRNFLRGLPMGEKEIAKSS